MAQQTLKGKEVAPGTRIYVHGEPLTVLTRTDLPGMIDLVFEERKNGRGDRKTASISKDREFQLW